MFNIKSILMVPLAELNRLLPAPLQILTSELINHIINHRSSETDLVNNVSQSLRQYIGQNGTSNSVSKTELQKFSTQLVHHLAFNGIPQTSLPLPENDQPNAARASYVVFDRSDKKIYVYPGDENTAGPPQAFEAGNNTLNPNGDPNTIGSNGPAPNGSFPIQNPLATGSSISYGPDFFPVGDCGKSKTCSGKDSGDIARQRGIGIHGGRSGPSSRTEGCIRVSNDTVVKLTEIYANDPINYVIIRD